MTMLTRIAQRGVRMPLRALSTSSKASIQGETPSTTNELPKGTVVPGEKVDPQLGDYPDMPLFNQQFRPYSKKWWDTQDRRNYGETVRGNSDLSSMSKTMCSRCGPRTPTRPLVRLRSVTF